LSGNCIVCAAIAGSQVRRGGKARALAALGEAELPIPPWIVLTSAAFQDSLTAAQRLALESAKDADQIRAVIESVKPSAGVCAELDEALTELCPHGQLVAIRSSASDEDETDHSFPGQLDRFLFSLGGGGGEKVGAVWRSGFSERIIAYRREHGLGLVPRPPAVLIQRMVHADVSGVAFGADPVTGRRGIVVVGALFGLGTALVSGECDARTYHLDRQGRIVQRTITAKPRAHRHGSATD